MAKPDHAPRGKTAYAGSIPAQASKERIIMGKKKKNKIRRLLREQALQQQKEQGATRIADPYRGQSPVGTVPTQQQEQIAAPRPEQVSVVGSEATEVKKDIIKILLTVAVLVAIIVAVYLVNIKSDFILKLGVWLSRVLNINV